MLFVSAVTSQLAKPKHCLLLLNPQTTPKLKQVNLSFVVVVVLDFVVGFGGVGGCLVKFSRSVSIHNFSYMKDKRPRLRDPLVLPDRNPT